jgi:multicomponent Na+:H+ antiporter subunit E
MLECIFGGPMKQLWYRIVLFFVLALLWILLVNPLTVQELIVGGAIALLVVLLPLPGSSVYGEIKLGIKRIAYLFAYLFVFIWAVIKSNFDVAYRVISPKLPINPGLVRIKTKLKSKIGRTVLANSITLTPGTITVDLQGDELLIHWIDVKTEDPEEATKQISEGFEKYLEVIFG